MSRLPSDIDLIARGQLRSVRLVVGVLTLLLLLSTACTVYFAWQTMRAGARFELELSVLRADLSATQETVNVALSANFLSPPEPEPKVK